MVARGIFLLLLVSLLGCGDIPCAENFDLYSKGLCIRTNGFIVNRINLNHSISIVENEFNKFHESNPVDLEELFIENGVTLTFVDDLGGKYLGLTKLQYTDSRTNEFYPTSMEVLGWSCWFRNFVTSHEILHVIAGHHLYTSAQDSADHIIPKLFKQKEDENILDASTVEESILLRIAPMCQMSIFLNVFGHQAENLQQIQQEK